MPETDSTDQFRLAGAWNFRDVGGARTADGSLVRRGRLFRSSELSSLDPGGQEELTTLDIRNVFDLRGAAEAERSGDDVVPADVRVHKVPFEKYEGEKAPHEVREVMDEDAQRQSMVRAYTSFPSLEGAGEAIGLIAAAIVDGDGGVLVHCAAGKDRAGWTIATLLRAVGVREEDILEDFLRSNDAIEPLRAHLVSVYSAGRDPGDIVISDAVLGVTADYYRRGMATVEELYGSFDRYLDAIGLDVETLGRLKDALLEPSLPR